MFQLPEIDQLSHNNKQVDTSVLVVLLSNLIQHLQSVKALMLSQCFGCISAHCQCTHDNNHFYVYLSAFIKVNAPTKLIIAAPPHTCKWVWRNDLYSAKAWQDSNQDSPVSLAGYLKIPVQIAGTIIFPCNLRQHCHQDASSFVLYRHWFWW